MSIIEGPCDGRHGTGCGPCCRAEIERLRAEADNANARAKSYDLQVESLARELAAKDAEIARLGRDLMEFIAQKNGARAERDALKAALEEIANETRHCGSGPGWWAGKLAREALAKLAKGGER